MSAYIDPVLIAMVSSAGMGREYTADDIAARARLNRAEAKEGLTTCVKRGLAATDIVRDMRSYRLTDEGRAQASRLFATRGVFKTRRVS
jgi:hypothetical protein